MARKKIIVSYPTLEQIEYVAHALARKLMSGDEPIPDFSTRFPAVLERCLAAPRHTYARRDLYPTLLDKAAILFYVLIKDHPFQNGNKRIAVMSLLNFLVDNGKWIKVDTTVLYRFARWVAESNPGLKDPVLSAIKQFLQQHLVDAQ